jgi:hypothetical protein
MSAAARPPSVPAVHPLVAFYSDRGGPDARGRTLEQILGWTDEQLEFSHDYIQTLFPLPEGSLFANAPIINEGTFLAWRQDDSLKRNLRRAFERIMAFYGFEVKQHDADGEDKEGTRKLQLVARDDAPKSSFWRWVVVMDHNHLRITRILRSLRVLGLEEEAEAFYVALLWTTKTYGRIGPNSRKYWQRAMKLPLHTAPDGIEVRWLEKYDAQKDSSDGDDTNSQS